MASLLHTSLGSLALHRCPKSTAAAITMTSGCTPIRCGPRDNRGPLVKGRILSTEAIQAIQSLKRAHRSDPTALPVAASKTLSRLIKSDLLATLRELLRQNYCALALHVFIVFRSEYHPDLGLYADIISAFARNKMLEEIDSLVDELEKEGVIQCDDKGLIRVVRALIGAGRRESTVRVYELMRRSGWGSSVEADDYMVRVLSKGLRRMGEVDLADEVWREFGNFQKGRLEKLSV